MVNSKLSYEDLQERIDNLSRNDWFNPSLFYPTKFGFNNDKDSIGNTATLFSEISKYFAGINSGTRNSVTVNASSYQKLLNLEDKITGDQISAQMSNIKNVEGLRFNVLPFEMDGRRIRVKKSTETNTPHETVAIGMLQVNTNAILKWLSDWQNEWYVYNGRYDAIKSKGENDSGLGEGYLGLDYLHIDETGACYSIGHLFLGGLLPIKVDGLKKLGPTESMDSIPTMTINCIYSQAILALSNANRDAYTLQYLA